MEKTDAEIELMKTNAKNQIIMEISRPDDGQSVAIFIKAPLLAEIVRKMANGNYPKADYSPIYKDLLVPLEANKERIITKPAVAKITKNFVGGTDFDWAAPRACLLYNADKLAEGFTLTYKVDQPVPPDVMRKWGKMLMDGCNDIIANARPFKMTWIMSETDGEKK